MNETPNTEREAAVSQSTNEGTPDPLFSKSPDDARDSVTQDAFSWGMTNTVIGYQIWDRAREYERYSAGLAASTADVLEKVQRLYDGYIETNDDSWIRKELYGLIDELTFEVQTNAK